MFSDAVDFLKDDLAKQSDVSISALINHTFENVYGRFADAGESAAYKPLVKARKAWYATIFLQEKNKLNQNPQAREAMINQNYKYAFGRDAKPAEIAYWKPRKEIYREIIEASRKFLYAPENAAELRAVVVRCLTDKKNGRPPLAKAVDEKIKESTPYRRLFNEMY